MPETEIIQQLKGELFRVSAQLSNIYARFVELEQDLRQFEQLREAELLRAIEAEAAQGAI